MKKSIFYLVAFLAVSCTEKEDYDGNVPLSKGVGPTEFVHLSDGAAKAGEVIFQSNETEASVKWITQSEFNLDTTQTTVSIEDGKGTIPIKWREKQSDGMYAPKGMYYKGWVVITAGENTKSIPLFWTNGQPLDTTKVTRQLMTRSAMAEPRLAAITFTPNPVILSASKGGKVIVRASEVRMAILDYSDFKDSYNLDLNDQVDMLEGDTPVLISFNWNSRGPATTPFNASLRALCEEIPTLVECPVSWTPEVSFTLEYADSNLPTTGNIPANGGMYMFQFNGTYTGTVQVRALANGIVIATGTETTDKQPQVGVTANLTNATRNITFQYKRADGDWTNLPVSTNRTQSAQGSGGGENVTYTNIQPEGNITNDGGTFTTYFSGYTGTILFRATLNGTELARQRGNVPGALALFIPSFTDSQGNVFFEYSTNEGQTWSFMESKSIQQESVAVNAIEPLGNIPAAGGTYYCGITGNYSKTVSVRALYLGEVLASAQGNIPANFKLYIPANTGTASRQISFMYKMGAGNWKLLEYKNQLGR